MYKLFGEVWDREEVPLKWNESRVVLIFKGGHKSKYELKNYRPISMANTAGKIFCSILNERLKEACSRANILGEEQNGFRADRRGEDNIYILGEIIENARSKGNQVFLAFLDVEKAYDSLNRRTLMRVLEKMGFPEKIRNIINQMYTNTKARYVL